MPNDLVTGVDAAVLTTIGALSACAGTAP